MATTYRDLVSASSRWALAAYDRGWTPFPLSKAGNAKGGLIGCKAVLVKDWTRKDVSREDVESYAKPGTGLRMGAQPDGTIVAALDFDIPPADTAGKAWELFADFIGPNRAERVLIRNGRKAKFCVVVRIDEATQAMRSPYYDRGGDEARLEVFASHSNQIGAQGVHSVYAETDEPAVMYSWDGDTPADVSPSYLPLVTKAEIATFLTMLHDMMIEAGWTKRLMYEGEGSEGAVLFDLPEAVEAVARGLEDGDRVRMLEIIGEGESTQRGIVRHLGGDRVGVWDRNTAIMHLAPRFKGDDESPADKFKRFAEKVTAVVGVEKLRALEKATRADVAEIASTMDRSTWGIRNGVTGESWDDMNTLVANMQLRYAHFPSGATSEQIVDTFTGDGFGPASFKQMMLRHAMELPTGEVYAVGPRTGQPKTKMVNPVDQFLGDEKTVVIRGYQFDPSTTDRYVGGDGDLLASKLNLYEPPTRWAGVGSDPAWFETFLEYLVPDPVGRDFVRNWVACKVQRPEMRGVGLVLVTPAMGTGRNVLMKLVRQMLGEQWCSDVGADVLMGASGQSQFDDTMVNRLLITCDEIAMVGRSFDARMKAFERLKSVVDPYPQERTLNRKGRSSITGMVHYSAIMASNHPYDALPLPKGDRRFAVISCTEQPFKDTRADIKAIVDRVLPMGRKPDAAAMLGLWEYLMGLETDVASFLQVPMTAVRETMIEDGEGEVEDTIRKFLGNLPDDQHCFWFEDIVRRGEEWLKDRPNVRNAFKYNARKLLRVGFGGWKYPNVATRYEDVTSGESRVTKGVVHRVGVESTSKERGRFLSGR